MTDKQVISNLRMRIADHLVAIEDMFTTRPEITLFVRQPTFPDGSRDILLTTEKSLEFAIAAARKLEEDKNCHEIKAGEV